MSEKLTDEQAQSIANHLAFRFLLNVTDENRERVLETIKEAAIEARLALTQAGGSQ